MTAIEKTVTPSSQEDVLCMPSNVMGRPCEETTESSGSRGREDTRTRTFMLFLWGRMEGASKQA